MAVSTRAILAHEPLTPGKPNFKLETVTVRELNDDELLVRMIATGLCHTDINLGSVPKEIRSYPRVLGHEGAGIVERVGKAVTKAQPSSRVILTFNSCNNCQQCKTHHPCYCQLFSPRNLAAGADVFTCTNSSSEGSPQACYGLFFGQSSFANLSIVQENSVIDVTDVVESEEELKLFAPMGCGFQAGAGTVTVLAGAGRESTVVVMGLGGVGLAAIMAAKIKRCRIVIGIDRVAARIELARALGATHTIDTSDKSLDLVQEIKKLTDGAGSTISIDTTGNMALIQKGMDFTTNAGKVILVGIPPPDGVLSIHLMSYFSTGKMLVGSMNGDVISSEYIPTMIQWYKEGRFPVHKLVKYYPIQDYQLAIDDMLNGSTVKPVLVW